MTNHTKTVQALTSIEATLAEIRRAQERMEGEAAKLDRREIDREYAREARAKLETAFNASVEPKIDAMRQAVSEIEAAEQEHASSGIDLEDERLKNAVAIISAAGDMLPIELQQQIADQFAGDVPAQNVLSALFEKHGYHVRIVRTDFSKLAWNLRTAIRQFAWSQEKPPAAYYKIVSAANGILKACGAAPDFKNPVAGYTQGDFIGEMAARAAGV